MRTIKVIPKIIGISAKGLKFSPYGSFVDGDKIEKTSKFTWELNDNGSITIGLGRQAVDTIEEAEEIAKAMVKFGYIYIGIENS